LPEARVVPVFEEIDPLPIAEAVRDCAVFEPCWNEEDRAIRLLISSVQGELDLLLDVTLLGGGIL